MTDTNTNTDTDTNNDTPADDMPRLVALGANSRGAPSGHNLDVRGTVGPDHLGQETVDVDGHEHNRPGVRSSLPEDRPDDPRVKQMDTGETLPVLLESNMRADPVEGVQGTYTAIIEGECVRCGYDRLKRSVVTLAGERQETCMACHARQNPRAEHGYSMPTTRKERAEMRREAGPTLGTLSGRDVVDLEPDSGFGPRVALVNGRTSTSLWKEDVEELFWLLVDNDDIDPVESITAAHDSVGRVLLAAAVLPEDAGVAAIDAVLDAATDSDETGEGQEPEGDDS